tara:strand:- start:167 stop:826 length:660 start_codon:yes stop_codon:yes gene_type:complete
MEFENGVTPQDEPRQGRLNLEKDYFVYVAVMNCETTKYLKNIYDDRGIDRRGIVYNERTAKSVSAIKIGYSFDPIERIKHLAKTSPFDVNPIMHSRPLPKEAACKLEKQLHEEFEPFRMTERTRQREWFAIPAPELTNIILIFRRELADLKLKNYSVGSRSLPSKCGGTITEYGYGVEDFHYYPYKILTNDYDAFNWPFIAVGKETRDDDPRNKKLLGG